MTNGTVKINIKSAEEIKDLGGTTTKLLQDGKERNAKSR